MKKFLIVLCVALIGVGARPSFAFDPAGDELAARAVFEANLDAIRNQDGAAYLACYRDDPGLVRNGFGGIELGYEDLAAGVGEDTWPDSFEAFELEVFSITDGVVYGKYRYRVRYAEDLQEGISERIFLRTEDGWKIAVTTAFGAPDGALTPLEAESTEPNEGESR